jgi:hypothetical protein
MIKWTYNLPLELFLKLIESPITCVKHHWRFLTADTSTEWIVINGTIQVSSGFFGAFKELFEFNPDHNSIMSLNFRGKEALRYYREQEKALAVEIAERKEYERLKAKYG